MLLKDIVNDEDRELFEMLKSQGYVQDTMTVQKMCQNLFIHCSNVSSPYEEIKLFAEFAYNTTAESFGTDDEMFTFAKPVSKVHLPKVDTSIKVDITQRGGKTRKRYKK